MIFSENSTTLSKEDRDQQNFSHYNWWIQKTCQIWNHFLNFILNIHFRLLSHTDCYQTKNDWAYSWWFIMSLSNEWSKIIRVKTDLFWSTVEHPAPVVLAVADQSTDQCCHEIINDLQSSLWDSRDASAKEKEKCQKSM